MAVKDDSTATLDVRFVPDGYSDQEIADGADWPLGAGTYFVGVVFQGAFLPLAKFGGGKVNKLVARAAAAAAAEAATPAEPTA